MEGGVGRAGGQGQVGGSAGSNEHELRVKWAGGGGEVGRMWGSSCRVKQAGCERQAEGMLCHHVAGVGIGFKSSTDFKLRWV